MDKFERYVSSIKRKYRERSINREKQWPPCKSDKLVRLELVEGAKGESFYARHMRGQEQKDIKRIPIKYVDLFKVESGKTPVRKVLVEGDAGIGKTTLSIAVCEDWASERLFKQFKLLLLLPLRHKKIALVGSLRELLKQFHPSQDLCTSVAEYLSDIEGDGVLIIADGWDEIGKKDQLKESFLVELLFEGHLPFASIVITSRYSASAGFHKESYFDRFIEITGFDKKNIIEYIHSEFVTEPRKADHLKQQLEDNPLVESICSVPLNCAIICHLWHHNHKEDLPTTMTELYSKIIRNFIFRNIQKDADYSNISQLSSFDGLPEDLKQPWNVLCKFAFETLAKDKMVFSEDELDEGLTSTDRKNIFCFGLLQESLFLLEDGYGKSYHFLHRTFQEFLAAFHLAKLASQSHTKEDVFRRCDESLTIDGGLNIVRRFLLGIYFNVLKCHSHNAIKPYVSRVCGWYKNQSGRVDLSLCHSAFEAKNDFIYENIVQSLLINGCAYLYSHSAHDCAAVIDVIGHMHDCEIGVHFANCGIRQHQINYLGEVLNGINVKISMLNLQGNKLVSIESLFSAAQAQSSFQSLHILNCSDNMIKTINFLKCPFSSLIEIRLSNNPLGVSGMNTLQTAVAHDSLANLRFLYLENCLRTDNDSINPVDFSNFLRALSGHCPYLITLDLSQNSLGVTGALEFAKIKSQHKNLEWLNDMRLTGTHLGDEGLHSFIETLDSARVCYFNCLQLGDNDIHATGLKCLVEAIDSGKLIFGTILTMMSCINLELKGNPLGLKGLSEIGKLLSSSQGHLTSLSLNRCQLTETLTCDQDVCSELLIGRQLCQMTQNTTLKCLHLDGNKFTGDGVFILASLMRLCLSLEELTTADCGIRTSDFSQLFDKLLNFRSSGATYCQKLNIWMLRGNKINVKVESILIKGRLLFPGLCLAIGIRGNQISDDSTGKQEVRINFKRYGDFISQ